MLGAKATPPAGPLTVTIGVASGGKPSTVIAREPVPLLGQPASGVVLQPVAAASVVGPTMPSGVVLAPEPQPARGARPSAAVRGGGSGSVMAPGPSLDSAGAGNANFCVEGRAQGRVGQKRPRV